MKLLIKKTTLVDCYELIPSIFEDVRGKFIKTFHYDFYKESSLVTNFVEEFYSVSYKNVLRGLHFQVPPSEHTKLVYCLLGEVLDFVVDLRVGSPTYKQFEIFTISDKNARMIYIPPGFAHGFYVVSDKAIMNYKVTTVYDSHCDSGILWNSFDSTWAKNPILSERDKNFYSFKDFDNPFVYKEKN